MKFIDKLNDTVGDSFVGKYFEIKVRQVVELLQVSPITRLLSVQTIILLPQERGSTFTTELAGATATFLSMAYILAVNPRILAESGGPCVADSNDPAGKCCFRGVLDSCLLSFLRCLVTNF